MTKSFTKNNLAIIALLCIYAILFFVYNAYQKHISFEAEPLLDAHHYLKTYLYFKGELSQFSIKFPFNTRIGIPFLASLLPFEDAITNFKIIHFVFIGISVVFFHLSWKKLGFAPLYQLAFWLWYFFHWLGPIRYMMHEPIMVDTSCYLISSLFIWLFAEQKINYYWLLVPLSVAFKESLMPYIVMLSAYYFVIEKNYRLGFKYFLFFITGFLLLYILKLFFPMAIYHWKYQAPVAVLWYLKELALSPLNNLRWLAALILSGGLLTILFPYQKQHFKQPEFYLFLTSALLGFASGNDHSRIYFIGFPFMVLFFFKNLQDKKLLLFCIVFSIPFMHLFSTIPDITEVSVYESWHPEYSTWKPITMLFSYALGCCLTWKVVRKLDLTLPTWIHKKL